MTASPKELNYINNSGIYCANQDGSATPNTQTIYLGSVVQEARISHSLDVAENTNQHTYRKFKSLSHNYYKHDTSSYIVEGSSNDTVSQYEAADLPQYLTGWKWNNNGTYADFQGAGTTVDQTFINTYFIDSGNPTNLDLYAVWGNTKFMRVIVSSFETNYTTKSGTYDVNISDANSTSYNNNAFTLSDKFKTTIDYSNQSNHLELRMNGNLPAQGGYVEWGTGYGCLKTITRNSQYPSYYGFKSGTTLNITLTLSGTDGVPSYVMNGNVPEYLAYLCGDGLSRDYSTKNTTQITLTTNNNSTWTYGMSNVTSDKTLFVPIVRKPSVTVQSVAVNNNTAGYVEISSQSGTPAQINLTTKTDTGFPGDARYLWARELTGYTFAGWYSDDTFTTPVGNDANGNDYTTNGYKVILGTVMPSTFYAKFVAGGYTVTYFKEMPITD